MTADAVRARRREGPHRFSQNRPRTFETALQRVAAARKSKNQFSRNFRRRSIFDFCNTIGTKRTYRVRSVMSAFKGKAESAGKTGKESMVQVHNDEVVATS